MKKFEVKSALEANVGDIGKKYLFYVTGDVLVSLYQNEILQYNPNIQRGFETKITKAGVTEEPLVKKTKIKEIYESMIKGNFYESLIILNLTDKDNSSLEVTGKKGNNLSKDISTKEVIDILDGAHRIRALLQLEEVYNEFVKNNDERAESIPRPKDFTFPVELTILDTDKAQVKFYQLTLGAKISLARAEFFNNEDPTNKIIKDLMQKGNVFEDRVEVSKNAVSKKDPSKIVTFSILANGLREYAKPQTMTKDELGIFTKYLNHFFEELFSKTAFEGTMNPAKRESSLSGYVTFTATAFHGYIALAVELYNQHRAEINVQEYGSVTKALNAIEGVDFSNSNRVWIEDGIASEKNGKIVLASNMHARRLFATSLIKEFKTNLENIKRAEIATATAPITEESISFDEVATSEA